MADPAKPGPGWVWRTVLVVSLALNLLVVGVIGGAIVTGRIGGDAPRSFDLGLGPLARTLEREERRAIGRTLRRDPDVRRMGVRAQLAAMVAALRQDPFDPDQLRAIMAEQSNRLATLQQKAQAALIDQIAAMDPARRLQFADRLQRELDNPRRRGDGRSGG
ncbi:periplasmic heavy metal sensor [Yoonia sediminilitoris]|uniref:Heavy-metal resistance protein n=1 Tax=Yoonia sediminilitoris TaxID=1286148 RepID=A0A2T6KB39_9RHOB|nr:periplasmic heavy metal sensor [Yoonia sediminilitoris]PUB12094.1 heavy-metal resistance protein [Yoonia sediminilitoris]RCW92921.1 heavy-metal resistance protein [Yoonia sediminilitoris]